VKILWRCSVAPQGWCHKLMRATNKIQVRLIERSQQPHRSVRQLRNPRLLFLISHREGIEEGSVSKFFLGLYERGRFGARRMLGFWLMTILRNLAAEYLRSSESQ
jgi:hypothetical protein